MKVCIDSDELYPYYYLSEMAYGDEVELTEAEVLYCKEAEEAFLKYQQFLQDKKDEGKEKLKVLQRSENYSRAMKDLLNDELDAMKYTKVIV